MLLTPLAAVSTWLCITGAIHYSQFEKAKWETAGLITLAVFLMLIYCVWCMVRTISENVLFVIFENHDYLDGLRQLLTEEKRFSPRTSSPI